MAQTFKFYPKKFLGLPPKKIPREKVKSLPPLGLLFKEFLCSLIESPEFEKENLEILTILIKMWRSFIKRFSVKGNLQFSFPFKLNQSSKQSTHLNFLSVYDVSVKNIFQRIKSKIKSKLKTLFWDKWEKSTDFWGK